LFAFPRVIGLFLRSEAPGLVFSVTYPWGSFATTHSPPAAELRLPPQISHEKDGGLPPVTSEKPHDPRIFDTPCKQFHAPSSKRSREKGFMDEAEIQASKRFYDFQQVAEIPSC
jgi:hypothetical protein